MFNELIKQHNKQLQAREKSAYRRAAFIAATITNMSGRYVEHPVSIEDLLGERKEQTPEDMQMMMIAIVNAHGGEVVVLDG